MSTDIWIVTAEFTERDDAIALIELARELGIEAKLGSRAINISAAPIAHTRMGRLLLLSMRPGRSYDPDHFRVVLQDAGYEPRSWAPALSMMEKEGRVRRVARGIYQLVSPPVGVVVDNGK